jgi:hypothetical protein
MADLPRTAHAVQDDLHKDYSPPRDDLVVMPPVEVHVQNTVGTPVGAEFVVFQTFIILPGATNALLVLAEDPYRCRAIFQNRTGFLVVANSQALCQWPGNFAASTGNPPLNPQGFLMNASVSLEIKSQSKVWVVSTDPTANAYLSVMIERNNPPG